VLLTNWAEQAGNPWLAREAGVDIAGSEAQAGGNLEGKETRFGIGGTVLSVAATSNGATGSYNAMHDSLTPLGGLVPLVNMLLGELIFGGLGTGIYSMILVVLLGLFLSGLMVGRTPEFLGKRLGPAETKLIVLYVLLGPAVILLLTGLAVLMPDGLAGLTTNDGPHGFTEVLYAYTSANANNGQNFAGLSANSVFYNLTTALAMLVGRFGLGVLALALAGVLAQQPRRRPTLGTLPTDSWVFAGVLLGTILIVGALSYLPALALGPIVEQFRLAPLG
jgi:K+-transporting ATPase ATPase A chain